MWQAGAACQAATVRLQVISVSVIKQIGQQKDESLSLSYQEIQSTIAPLRLIFWGGLMCILDFRFIRVENGVGFRFDIINDFIAMLMITWSMHQLWEIGPHDRYRTAMRFVTITSAVSCFAAFNDHFIYDAHPFISFLHFVLGIMTIASTVVFCIAMQWLCREFGLGRSEQSWRTTTLLFAIIYAIPLGLIYFASAIVFIAGSSFNFDLGPASLLLLPVFCIPPVHLFVSTSRMKTEAESVVKIGRQGGAPDTLGADDI